MGAVGITLAGVGVAWPGGIGRGADCGAGWGAAVVAAGFLGAGFLACFLAGAGAGVGAGMGVVGITLAGVGVDWAGGIGLGDDCWAG